MATLHAWRQLGTPYANEDLWKQLKNGKEIAEKGSETILDAQMICHRYEIINNTGLFARACKDWREKPANQKMFRQMQTFSTNEADDYEKHQPTARMQGYANNAEQIQEVVHHELTNIFNSNQNIFGNLQLTPEEAQVALPPPLILQQNLLMLWLPQMSSPRFAPC